MFSMCNSFMQNQAVLSLSSIISQYSSIRGHRHKVKCVQQDRVTSKDVNRSSILCLESLSETSEIFSENDLKEIRQSVTPKVLHHLALYGPELLLSRLSSLTTGPYHSLPLSTLKERRTWYDSHVSCNTFLENKQGSISLSDVTREPQVRPLFRITQDLIRSQQNLSASYIPSRGFKTQQYNERKKLQNVTLAGRLKDGLKSKKPFSDLKSKKPISDLKSEEPISDLESEKQISDLESRKKPVTVKELFHHANENNMLKSMLTEDVPKDVQRNIKVAFAEGYMSAEPKPVKSRILKWLQNMSYAVVIFISSAFVIWILVGGSMLKMSGSGHENEISPEDVTVCFEDVRGANEAKEELQEIVEFLRNPEKYTSLGAELPKGVLLVGPPGTGKTLLARAVAGEAGVPFFHVAGPEFDEILVGQGARRIRDLFRSAKARAPCVIFIDEIDSVGAKRSSSLLHPYANQTINQLLSEMDGFHRNEGVIVLGATNRQSELDKALLRPGRFDVQVNVPMPDLVGREEIFTYYLGKLKIGEDVDKKVLSRGTTGFTGADIKNLANLAALKAASDQVDSVSMKHLEAARDKILMGPERKSRIPDEDVNRITAYHEAGHALVSLYTKDAQPLHKVTIIPRGMSLGHTAYIPAKEHYYLSKSRLLALMDTLMGGRAGEELVLGADHVTSGASDDLVEASRYANNMVRAYGMSNNVGLRSFTEARDGVYFRFSTLGDTTKDAIDAEISRLLQESYDRAKAILKKHEKEHKVLAEALMKYETLDAEDVKAIINGHAPK